MAEYNYQSDYEREQTQKYEDAYTPEEIELNKKLLDECYKEPTVDGPIIHIFQDDRQ